MYRYTLKSHTNHCWGRGSCSPSADYCHHYHHRCGVQVSCGSTCISTVLKCLDLATWWIIFILIRQSTSPQVTLTWKNSQMTTRQPWSNLPQKASCSQRKTWPPLSHQSMCRLQVPWSTRVSVLWSVCHLQHVHMSLEHPLLFLLHSVMDCLKSVPVAVFSAHAPGQRQGLWTWIPGEIISWFLCLSLFLLQLFEPPKRIFWSALYLFH